MKIMKADKNPMFKLKDHKYDAPIIKTFEHFLGNGNIFTNLNQIFK